LEALGGLGNFQTVCVKLGAQWRFLGRGIEFLRGPWLRGALGLLRVAIEQEGKEECEQRQSLWALEPHGSSHRSG
jgi:hypothetical protein